MTVFGDRTRINSSLAALAVWGQSYSGTIVGWSRTRVPL